MITAQQYINRAMKYIGVVEGTPRHAEIVKAYNSIKPLPRGYRLTVNDAWCAGFASAVALLCGFGDNFPYECGVERMKELAKKRKMWVKVVNPREGWLVVYDWQGDGHADHVGIIAGTTSKQIKVIEGNYNDAVRVRIIAKDSPKISGYIALKYLSEENTSNEEVAREVIAGRWGNGEQRRKSLKKAGYDPDKIQKIVNKLLK